MATDDMKFGGMVVKLTTAKERAEEEEREFQRQITEEAATMLKHAHDLVQEKGVAGLAICVVFNDGTYGRILPEFIGNQAALLGSIQAAAFDLHLRAYEEDDGQR